MSSEIPDWKFPTYAPLVEEARRLGLTIVPKEDAERLRKRIENERFRRADMEQRGARMRPDGTYFFPSGG